jgi:hypothetical protein
VTTRSRNWLAGAALVALTACQSAPAQQASTEWPPEDVNSEGAEHLGDDSVLQQKTVVPPAPKAIAPETGAPTPQPSAPQSTSMTEPPAAPQLVPAQPQPAAAPPMTPESPSSPPLTLAGNTTKQYGDWELRVKLDAFGEKDAYLAYDLNNRETFQVDCKQGGGYSVTIKSRDPVGWHLKEIDVKYRIGNGPIKTEQWSHMYVHDFTYLDDGTGFVNEMRRTNGKLAFQVLMTQFNPSLNKFDEAVTAMDANCKR